MNTNNAGQGTNGDWKKSEAKRLRPTKGQIFFHSQMFNNGLTSPNGGTTAISGNLSHGSTQTQDKGGDNGLE